MNILLRRYKLGKTSCEGIQAASQEGLTWFRNDDPLAPQGVHYLFRWGCTSPFPAEHTINKAEAISLASDKALTREKLQRAGVSIPPTWFSQADVPEEALRRGVITRPAHHWQGRMVFKSRTRAGLAYSFHRCQRWDGDGEPGHAYISAFIPKDHEYRVYVIQGRVAAVAEKTIGDPTRVAWNHARGGSFHNVSWRDWPIGACLDSLAAMRVVGLDFGGVDVMTKGEEIYILEINAAPSLSSPYRQQVFAKCFDYMVAYGSQHIPVTELPPSNDARAYRHIIHPALREGTEPTRDA